MLSLTLSHRSKKNRLLLVRRIFILAMWYAVPAGGLALFFLTTGLNRKIDMMRREEAGAQYVKQAIRVHNAAINQIWQEERAPGRGRRPGHRALHAPQA